MRTIKVMSIIGICLFVLSFLIISYYINYDSEAAVGWGVIAVFYGLALSIVSLVNSNKLKK
jgi:small-conductance mechanosensitive channel